MKVDKFFKGQYVKAADLDDDDLNPRVIDRVEVATFDSGDKPVLFFQDDDRGLVLNKTNTRTIGAAYGYETDAWAGKRVILFTTTVDFQGSTVDAIRVKIPKAQPSQVSQPEDGIPF